MSKKLEFIRVDISGDVYCHVLWGGHIVAIVKWPFLGDLSGVAEENTLAIAADRSVSDVYELYQARLLRPPYSSGIGASPIIAFRWACLLARLRLREASPDIDVALYDDFLSAMDEGSASGTAAEIDTPQSSAESEDADAGDPIGEIAKTTPDTDQGSGPDFNHMPRWASRILLDRDKEQAAEPELDLMAAHLDYLGYQVTDKVRGIVGVVTSLSFDLYGCIQVLVSPCGADASVLWLDISRVDVDRSGGRVMPLPDFTRGYIAEGKKGPANKPVF